MGKTRRNEPRNGEFRKLKVSKQKRNKKQRQNRACLQREVGLTNRNPNTGFVNCRDAEPNEETLAAIEERAEFSL